MESLTSVYKNLDRIDVTAFYDGKSRCKIPVESKPINLMGEEEFKQWLEDSNKKSRIENPEMIINNDTER